ncbi:hypothetical protein GCM10010430_67110 [Kitasatospora cystarginea]|uniref:Malonyl-CoA:ACP transacylase (MAT) domain-containing protein n=1 Tax=Kitasatospora cystarginea TaxID=58350 RepID=A0ABP5RTW2_9ACTN
MLSGTGGAALHAQADALRENLAARPELGLADVAHSLATGRTALEDRAVVVADDREALLGGLTALGAGEPAARLVRGSAAEPARVAFLVSRQGGQLSGMGRELAATQPVFAAALDEVCAHLDGPPDRLVRDLMFTPADSPDADLLDRTGCTQAALFAFEVALYRLCEHWGLEPEFVMRHSIDELAAATWPASSRGPTPAPWRQPAPAGCRRSPPTARCWPSRPPRRNSPRNSNAELTDDQVDAVEAHGTGTALGVPIETQALITPRSRP